MKEKENNRVSLPLFSCSKVTEEEKSCDPRIHERKREIIYDHDEFLKKIKKLLKELQGVSNETLE
jgi:hypothetical protein